MSLSSRLSCNDTARRTIGSGIGAGPRCEGRSGCRAERSCGLGPLTARTTLGGMIKPVRRPTPRRSSYSLRRRPCWKPC